MESDKDRHPRIGSCWECGRRLRSMPGGGKYYIEIEIDEHARIMHIDCANKYKCMAESNGQCSENGELCKGTNTKCLNFLSHHMTKRF